ncbi:MAG: hypothetical protein LBT63_03525 [Holosporaceae bacterium]|nr:hypothetical protein [Holosporaceae bacterium]
MPNQENFEEEEKEIKAGVRESINQILRINKHVDPKYKNPITREEAKDQDVGERIRKLQKDINSLERILDKYGGAKLGLSEQKSEKSGKKPAAPKRRRRRRSSRGSSGGYPRGIYTVKSGYHPSRLPPIGSTYGYSGGTGRSFYGNGDYKIKSYGAEGGGSCGQGRSCSESKSSRRRAKGEHGEPAPFRSTPGCETGCGS